MCDRACDLASELFAGDDGNLLAHMLVGVEVIAQVCVVLLSDDSGHLLHGFGENMTHVGGGESISSVFI